MTSVEAKPACFTVLEIRLPRVIGRPLIKVLRDRK